MSYHQLIADRDVRSIIADFNQNRRPDLIDRKYRLLREDAFTFYRGTCHLFYLDLPLNEDWLKSPLAWVCGDLHLENFGAFKGDDRQIYFGINDFDESALAPCSWDLIRLLVSIDLAAEDLDFGLAIGRDLADYWLDKYLNYLTRGRLDQIDGDNAKGLVKNLLEKLSERQRSDFLDKRTEIINNRRQLTIDDDKIIKVTDDRANLVKSALVAWAGTSDFFTVLDVGFRVAGTGSLGIDRYLILVEGRGSPDGNYLLDLKYQPTAATSQYLTAPQPAWSDGATRVATVQQLVQPAPPALLATVTMAGLSYLLRELQPTQDKVKLKETRGNLDRLQQFIKTTAKVTATAHLHGAGKQGAATLEELINWADSPQIDRSALLTYATEYAQQVRRDYQNFR
jgi:uncharacterized protein (DUF2252 family)